MSNALDNYEWSHVYGKRFGMVHVDFETSERTQKLFWYALKRFLEHYHAGTSARLS